MLEDGIVLFQLSRYLAGNIIAKKQDGSFQYIKYIDFDLKEKKLW